MLLLFLNLIFILSAFGRYWVRSLTAWYLLGSFLKADHLLPCYEQMNELLTQNTKRFFLFVLFKFISCIFGHLFEYFGLSFIRLNFNKLWQLLLRNDGTTLIWSEWWLGFLFIMTITLILHVHEIHWLAV